MRQTHYPTDLVNL